MKGCRNTSTLGVLFRCVVCGHQRRFADAPRFGAALVCCGVLMQGCDGKADHT